MIPLLRRKNGVMSVVLLDRTLKPRKSNSFFLFGARGTGKSTILNQLFGTTKKILWIDLLSLEVEDRYARNPDLLFDEIKNKASHIEWVIIDEVQKVPVLLDVVHRVIENKEFSPPHFALTGSSARKLKHGGANLLAGRAFVNNLYPMTHRELDDRFDLDFTLNFGSLPQVFQFEEKEDVTDYLKSYALTYLKEEIWAEHLIQKLDPFRKFLEVAAQSNGHTVNFKNISRDVGVDEKTVKRYYQILEETLLGFMLEAHHHSKRKRLIKAPKFYFFDCGVTHALSRTLRQTIIPGTFAYGNAFEHFYILELHRLNEYHKLDFQFSYMLTESGCEIDVLIDRPGMPMALIEIKSSERTSDEDAKHLKNIRKDFQQCECYVVSNDRVTRSNDDITYIHWQDSFESLGY
jgi:predicted AAA+ superfamily ATPase